MQFTLGRVGLADLADFAADAHGHAVGLERADERHELGGALVVGALLLLDRLEGEVDKRRGIDIDVAIPRVDRQPARPTDLLGHRLGVRCVLPGIELVVIALEEDRPRPAGGDGTGEAGGCIVDRSLIGVGLLAARQFQDQGADLVRGRGFVDDPGHIEGLGPDVDRRDRKAGNLAAGTGQVEVLDAG